MAIYDDFPDGIKKYVCRELNTAVYFPEKYVACKYCKFCLYNRNNTSSMCAVTGDTLYVIDKGVGVGCPLVIKGG